MGYRPNQTPARRPTPNLPDPGRRHVDPVAAAWDRIKDDLRVHPKSLMALVMAEVGIFASVGMNIMALVMGGLLSMCVMTGIARPAPIAATPKQRDAVRFLVTESDALSFDDRLPTVEEHLVQSRVGIDKPCRCGSEEDAVLVEVEYEPGVLTTVGALCPDCREPRTEKQLRVQADRARSLERAAATVLRIASDTSRGEPVPEHVDVYEYDKTRDVLAGKMAEFNHAAESIKIEGGNAHISVAEMDRVEGLVAAITYLRDRLDAMRALPAPGATKPRPGLMIEQGEWVYEIPWHAEDDLCAEDDHEWEDIMSHGSATPVRSVCARCGARRRPRAQPKPDNAVRTFYQPDRPPSAGEGDMWFDTDDGGCGYRFDGDVWQVVELGGRPSSAGEGDMWFDTDDGTGDGQR